MKINPDDTEHKVRIEDVGPGLFGVGIVLMGCLAFGLGLLWDIARALEQIAEKLP